jgi:DNA-directed RNA polymerase specialized sigma24 family protein
MILEGYYVDGCNMEEIAKRIGYKNGNSVKSKKNKVLKRIQKMRRKEGAASQGVPQAA